MRNFNFIPKTVIALLFATLAGCTVHPAGEREERAAAFQAGQPFEARPEIRRIAPLPENPSPAQLVEYALLNNAELEQHYWEWRSAIEQIPQDGSQTATLNVSTGTTINNGHTSWNSSTVGLSNDPMTDIKVPAKLDAAAKQSLETARAAGRRFIKARYALRNKVLNAYYDYALTAELIRLEQSNQQLLKTTATVTESRNRAGTAGQQDVLKAGNELDLSANDIANMQSQLTIERAALNALLSRPTDAALPAPAALPSPRLLAYTDTDLLDLAAKQNPELTALADEIRGHEDGIHLARLQYIPDFNLSAGTDLAGMAQSLLGQATIPFFRHEALDAAIAQSQANLRVAESMRRQAQSDLAAQVISDITILRDADRQLELFDHTILPRASQIVSLNRSAYETAHATLLDLLDDQRSLISIKRLVANLTITREKSLADLESITAADLSTPHNEPAPATQPMP